MVRHDPPDFNHWLTIATIVFLIWALLFAGVRAWAKLNRSLPWSFYDFIFGASFIIAIVQCITVFLAVSYGYGRPQNKVSVANRIRYKESLFASQILYILSIGLSRCSTAFFLGGLTRDKRQKRPSFAVAAVCVTWTIGCVIAVALRGNLNSPWMVISGTSSLYKRWLVIEALGACLELTLWVVSIVLVWNLNMPGLKRLKVVYLFALRLLIIPIIAGRLYFISPSNQANSTDSMTLSIIFTEAAMQYSLMAECMACLKPFLQPFYSGYGLSTDYGLGSLSNPSRDPYHELSNVSQSEADIKKPEKVAERESHRSAGSTRMSSRRSIPRLKRKEGAQDEFLSPPNHTSFVEASRSRPRSYHGPADEDDIELLQENEMSIKQTKTVSVIGEDAVGIAQ